MKRLLMLIIMMGIISLCLGTFASECFADGAPLIMNGELAFPINNNSIKLESEVINIFYGNGEDNNVHTAEVVFNFENTGDETEVEFGFPNIVYVPEQNQMDQELLLEMRNFKVYHYPSMETIDWKLVDGGSLPWYQIFRFNSYFNWKLNFKKYEKKSIKVTYEFFGFHSTGYILRTGALWKDDIDQVDIYVHFKEPAAHAGIYASPHDYYYNGKGIEWHYEDIEPHFDITVYYEPLAKTITTDERFYEPVQVDIEDKYDWDQRIFYIRTRGNHFLRSGKTEPIYETYSIKGLREMIEERFEICKSIKNEILARHGYIFADKKYKEIFEDLSWYEPNPSFSLDDLNFIEKINIDTIERFENVISLDVSDDELLEDFKEYYSLYDDGKNLDDIYWMNQAMGFYEPLKINVDYNSVLESGYNDYAIESYQNLFHAYDSNENITILPQEYEMFFVDKSIDTCRNILRNEIDREFIDYYYLDSEKMFFSYISDNNKNLCKYIDKKLYIICDLFNLPSLKDVSPNGNYILFGDMTNSNLFEGRIYLLSTKDGRLFMIGRGDYVDYEFNWSSNGDCLCFYKSNGKGDEVTVFNGDKNYFKKVKFIQKAIDSAHTNINGDVVVQSKDKIYLLENNSSNWINITSGTKLIGFDSNSDDVLNYYDTNIYQYNKSNNENVLVARTYVSIWDTELSKNGNYHLHAGRDTLYVYCSKTNLLYRYDNMMSDTIIKESPTGEYILVNPEKLLWDENEYIIDAETKERKELNVLTDEDFFISWYDEKTLIGKKVLGEHYIKYNVDNDKVEKDKIEIEIDSLEYYCSEGMKKLLNRKNVKYSALLEQDALAKLYHKGGFLNSNTDKMLGIIEESDLYHGNYLAYVIDDDVQLIKVHVKKDNCKQLLNNDGIKEAIVYNSPLYKEPDWFSKRLINNCISEARIIDSKNDWYYVGINNKYFGWVPKITVLFDFDNFITEEVNDTDKEKTKQHTVIDKDIEDEVEVYIGSDKYKKEVHQDNSKNNVAGYIVLGLMLILVMSGTVLNFVVKR